MKATTDSQSGFCVFDPTRSAATIVVPVGAPAAVRRAADELAHWLARLGAGTAAVEEEPHGDGSNTGDASRVIHVGAARTAANALGVRSLPNGGFHISVTESTVCITAADPADTPSAVAYLLESYCGIRWLWPGESGTVVPSLDRLYLPRREETVAPGFVWRELGPTGALWQQYGKEEKERQLGITEAHQQTYHEWERRNRFGGPLLSYGHIIGTEIIQPARYSDEHPEYFALVNGVRDCDPETFDGKHGHQPCTTNPDVIRLMIEHLRRSFDENPNLKGISVAMNDGRGFCECDGCRALDREAPPGTPEGSISHRIFTFTNAIAQEIKKTHPDRFVVALAYHACLEPPAFPLEDNVLVLLCLNSAYHWSAEAEENSFRLIREWTGKASHRGVYEYFIQGDLPDLPRVNTESITRLVGTLRAHGYRYFMTQAGDGFALNGVNYYLLSKLLWDPALSADALLDDYCTYGFGTAGPTMREYLDLLERTHRRELTSTSSAEEENEFLAIYTEDVLRPCEELLARAESETHDDANRRRIEFLRQGFHYWRLTMDALRLSYADDVRPLWQATERRHELEAAERTALERAKHAWDERDGFVEAVKNDFVISYLWVRYNDFSRKNCGGIGQRIRTLLGGEEQAGRFEENIKV
jgi:hypothetical protein